MLVLITYDVNTEDPAGRKRLRQIARQCVNYGQRVQNSVFECMLDTAQCKVLQAKLLSIMDPERDSLRFYYLGQRYECEGEANIVFPAGSHSNIIKWTGDFRKFKRANCDTDTAPGHSSLRNCTFVTKHTCAFVLFRCRSPHGERGLKF